MKPKPSAHRSHASLNCPSLACRRAAVVAALGLAAVPAGAVDLKTNLVMKVELGAKEMYDSNVYIQDVNPDPANVAAAKADGFNPVEPKKGSWVTSILPKLGLDYKPSTAFNATVGYALDASFYESAHSEDYLAHRGTLNFGGKIQEASWELANTASYTDGSAQGPTFARGDDIPAIGGIPLRDRRDAFVFRNSFRVTQPLEKWFIRPVATVYIHDFKTDQYSPTLNARGKYAYENYIDRQDVAGGLDVGYEVAQGTRVLVGYRYGRQDQFDLNNVDSPYDSAYHRVLVGVEGSPASWLKLAAVVGPDIRQWQDSARLDQLYPAFDQDELLYYWDVSATFVPSKADSITLKATRYEQPAFSSPSVYEDIRTDLTWRHKFSEPLSASAGFTAYLGDWQAPVNREDWIYTPNAAVAYNFSKHLTTEVAYSYDWVDSNVSSTEGREFTRHLVWLSAKYTF